MASSIKLNLQATAVKDEPVAGWQAETYVLSATARGAAQKPTPVDLADDDVLEIELENGTRLLVAGEDAGRYLGQPDATVRMRIASASAEACA